MANMTRESDWEHGEINHVTTFAKPGFPRRNPRTRSSANTSDMVVYRPNGDVFRVSGTKARTSSTRKRNKRAVSVDMQNALDIANRRKSYSANFAPIGNVD